MELCLPLALRLVQRVCGHGARQMGWRRQREGRGTNKVGGVSAGGYKNAGPHAGRWKEDQGNMRKTEDQRKDGVEAEPEKDGGKDGGGRRK